MKKKEYAYVFVIFVCLFFFHLFPHKSVLLFYCQLYANYVTIYYGNKAFFYKKKKLKLKQNKIKNKKISIKSNKLYLANNLWRYVCTICTK